jgi:uncharacterized membrane protein YbhN (UPF0104 family)
MQNKLSEKNDNITRKILIGFVLGIVLYIFIIFWGDITSIKSIMSTIPISIYMISIVSVLFGYGIRSFKWYYSLQKLDIKIPFTNSLDIFLIGTALAVSPGKIGELIKSFILKRNYGIEITRSSPIIIADHLTTLFVWLIYISLGISILPFGYIPFMLLCIMLLIFIVLIQNKKLSIKISNKITTIRFLKKYKVGLLNFIESSFLLFKFKTFTCNNCFIRY